MTYQDNPPREGTSGPAGTGQPAAETPSGGQAREWIAQLQSMIENLAEQAVPVVREIGAKAAELAAVAAEKAGPVAAKAAEVTADVGTRFAERSRSLATDLRRDAEAEAMRHDAAAGGTAPSDVSAGGPPGTGSSASTMAEGDAARPAG